MKKVLATIAMLAIPGLAMAIGLEGDCYDCHTMHNSEGGVQVAQKDDGTNNAVPNLLKFDCLACHAMNPMGGQNIVPLSGGSSIPQVMHNAGSDLAGGNFGYGNTSLNKVHNVKELFAGDTSQATQSTGAQYGNPPGMVSASLHTLIFTSATDADPYDNFSCAGAAGCHGTRNQLPNGSASELVGMAAISGAHHNSYDGAKDAANYIAGEGHSGQKVADGYRFIPGLKGYGNEAARWQNVDENSHNEYYGQTTASFYSSCSSCHVDGATPAATTAIAVPNGSMSGFCSTCHGNFHSSGKLTGDREFNGTSGAFLRHPSDFVIPNKTEYAAYTVYDVSAPVARPTLYSAASAVVTPTNNATGDMVMCLSCHAAHGTPNDYLLRFDYGLMTAGAYTSLADVDVDGQGGDGCLACHTEKGIQQ